MLAINQTRCDLCAICVEACPFGAMAITKGRVEINEACRLCNICVKRCPQKAIVQTDGIRLKADRDKWRGLLVFAEYSQGKVHPVTLELIGKARQLAAKINHPVYCVFIGSGIENSARELLEYGLDKVFVYDHEAFEYYREDIYAHAFTDCIKRIKPSIVLVGATSIGRSLAPRLSTRLRSGLTADCTVLDVKDNSDLVQIRPAFGGNIMAQIVTEYSRPQFATVRYKVMDKAQVVEGYLASGEGAKGTDRLEILSLPQSKLKSDLEVLAVTAKEEEVSISEAEVIVAGGRGLKEQSDLAMLAELASLLGGQTAVTRPLVEAGWAPYTRQIGLSGRTVRPRLIILCGISGAVQFTACMNTADCIIAINNDKNAPVLKVAHYGIIGDLYEIVPRLCAMIKGGGRLNAL